MVHTILLAAHIGAGVVGLAAGPAAMLARKSPGQHRNAGRTYQVATMVLVLTALGLTALDWSALWFFALIAVGTEAAALSGWMLARYRPSGWQAMHLRLMAGSYISFVTAFLVVNWSSPVAWVLPTIVGTPLIACASRRQARQEQVPHE